MGILLLMQSWLKTILLWNFFIWKWNFCAGLIVKFDGLHDNHLIYRLNGNCSDVDDAYMQVRSLSKCHVDNFKIKILIG